MKILYFLTLLTLATSIMAETEWKFSQEQMALGPLISEMNADGKVKVYKLLNYSNPAIEVENKQDAEGNYLPTLYFLSQKKILETMAMEKTSPEIMKIVQNLTGPNQYPALNKTQYDFDVNWKSADANPKVSAYIKHHTVWEKMPYIGIPLPPTTTIGTVQMKANVGKSILTFRSIATKKIWSDKYWAHVRTFANKELKNVLFIETTDPMNRFADEGLYLAVEEK